MMILGFKGLIHKLSALPPPPPTTTYFWFFSTKFGEVLVAVAVADTVITITGLLSKFTYLIKLSVTFLTITRSTSFCYMYSLCQYFFPFLNGKK